MTVGDAAEDLRPQGSPLSFTAGRFVYIEKSRCACGHNGFLLVK